MDRSLCYVRQLPHELVLIIAAMMLVRDAVSLLTTCKPYYALYLELPIRRTTHYRDIVKTPVCRDKFYKWAITVIDISVLAGSHALNVAVFGTPADVHYILGTTVCIMADMHDLIMKAIVAGNTAVVKYLFERYVITEDHRKCAMCCAKPEIIAILGMPASLQGIIIYSADDADIWATRALCKDNHKHLSPIRAMLRRGDATKRILYWLDIPCYTYEYALSMDTALRTRRERIIEAILGRECYLLPLHLQLIYEWCCDTDINIRMTGIRIAHLAGMEKFTELLRGELYSNDLIAAVLTYPSIPIPVSNIAAMRRSSTVSTDLLNKLTVHPTCRDRYKHWSKK